MKAYRIGRIAQPWINFEPPIRGGVYRKNQDDDSDCATSSEDDDLSLASTSVLGSFNSSSTSLNLLDATEVDSNNSNSGSGTRKRRVSRDQLKDYGGEGRSDSDIYRRRAFQASSDTQDGQSSSSSPILSGLQPPVDTVAPGLAWNELVDSIATRKFSHPAVVASPSPYTSADIYTSVAVQKEIDDDTRNYPSLDLKTQRNITLKYQALHQRVKDEGFYDCRYTEYGKEFIRYALLFAIFFTALRYEWYLTAAAFLGLFWVSQWVAVYLIRARSDHCSIK